MASQSSTTVISCDNISYTWHISMVGEPQIVNSCYTGSSFTVSLISVPVQMINQRVHWDLLCRISSMVDPLMERWKLQKKCITLKRSIESDLVSANKTEPCSTIAVVTVVLLSPKDHYILQSLYFWVLNRRKDRSLPLNISKGPCFNLDALIFFAAFTCFTITLFVLCYTCYVLIISYHIKKRPTLVVNWVNSQAANNRVRDKRV